MVKRFQLDNGFHSIRCIPQSFIEFVIVGRVEYRSYLCTIVSTVQL